MEDKDSAYGIQISKLNQELEEKDIKYARKTEKLQQNIIESQEETSRVKREFSQYKDEEKKSKKEHQEKIRKQIDEIAKQERDKILKKAKMIVNIFIGFAIVIFIFLTIYTTVFQGADWLWIPNAFLAAVSAYSLFDLLMSKKKVIMNILEKFANRYETKVREEKYQEYKKLFDINIHNESKNDSL